MSYVEMCKSTKQLNTGALKECLASIRIDHILTKEGFAFESEADVLDLTKWNDAVKNKDIVVLYKAFEMTSANKEAIKFEPLNEKFVTKKAVKGVRFESYLSYASHRALKSYRDSEYTRVIEVLDDGQLVMVMRNGKIMGQKLSFFDVGIMEMATQDKPNFSVTELTYEDYEELEDYAYIFNPKNYDWLYSDIKKVFDATIVKVSSSTTEFKFKVALGNYEGVNLALHPSLDYYKNLVANDFIVKQGNLVLLPTFTAADSDGVYTLTGTYSAGATVGLNGIRDKTTMFVEAINTISHV